MAGVARSVITGPTGGGSMGDGNTCGLTSTFRWTFLLFSPLLASEKPCSEQAARFA